MQTLTQIKALLAEHGLRPKHALGQNFLHDHNQLRKLLVAAGVSAPDAGDAAKPDAATVAGTAAGCAAAPLVLEVGPGTGTLTETLLDAGARVVACELDRQMAAIVRQRNATRLWEPSAGTDHGLPAGRLLLVEGDCLESKHALSARMLAALRAAGGGNIPPFILVANLPYQAATPLMATLLEHHPECLGQFVTIQREVADRLMASPGTAAYGPLSVTVQLLASVELIGVVPPGCFWPAPKVTSAMVAIRPHQARPVHDWESFAHLVQRTFGQRRKQLGTILGRAAVEAAGFDPQRRPESLSPQEWVALARGVAPPGTYLRS